jgi:hypothetical protein
MLRIDHVVRAVRDLDEAGARFVSDYGLASAEGGRHGRWGTANRIVPLGQDYIELISVVDEQTAAATSLGRTILDLTEQGDAWLAICLSDDNLDSTAKRLGIEVQTGSRTRPDGETITWRSAGLEDPRRDRAMPFFIQWQVPAALHPGEEPIDHPCGARGIDWVQVSGDWNSIEHWIGGFLGGVPIRVTAGPPEIRSVALRTPSGELEVR